MNVLGIMLMEGRRKDRLPPPEEKKALTQIAETVVLYTKLTENQGALAEIKELLKAADLILARAPRRGDRKKIKTILAMIKPLIFW